MIGPAASRYAFVGRHLEWPTTWGSDPILISSQVPAGAVRRRGTQGKAVRKDGTEVPYFLVKREGTATDGDTPTLLCGYGGFEIGTFPMPA